MIAISIAASALMLSMAVYLRPQPRYAVYPVQGAIIRLNLHSGEMLACNHGCTVLWTASAQADPFSALDEFGDRATRNSN